VCAVTRAFSAIHRSMTSVMDATVSTKKLDAVGEFEVAIEFASMVQIKYIILHDAST
jgi:hypothetical protein